VRRPGEQLVSVKSWVIVVLSSAALASCERLPVAERPFSVAFVVESDPGVRLPRSHVFVDGEPVGESNSDGRVETEIHGQPGQQLRISHDCPDGHEAPSESKALRLRKFAGVVRSQPHAMEITLRCRPLTRLAAFVVRASNGPHLPVLLDGERVARTNRSGVAHFSIRGAPGTEYTVEIGTGERPRLLPRSPTHLFILPDADEIFVINQVFDAEREPRRPARRRTRITKIE
jgi:hypothetical protein